MALAVDEDTEAFLSMQGYIGEIESVVAYVLTVWGMAPVFLTRQHDKQIADLLEKEERQGPFMYQVEPEERDGQKKGYSDERSYLPHESEVLSAPVTDLALFRDPRTTTASIVFHFRFIFSFR